MSSLKPDNIEHKTRQKLKHPQKEELHKTAQNTVIQDRHMGGERWGDGGVLAQLGIKNTI